MATLLQAPNPSRLILPEGISFGTIYADPPWPLDQENTFSSRRRIVYDRMSIDEIKAIPVPDVSHPDAHLWMWTTTSHLPVALDVVKHWGFTYRTLGVWRKSRLSLGWWLRSRHEFLIFAAKTTEMRHNPGSFSTEISGDYNGHSVKPDTVYPMIESLSPGPRLELFARDTARDGWHTLGDHRKPAEAFGQEGKRKSLPEPQDTVVRGVGGLEIKTGKGFVYLEKTITPVPVKALAQKGRRVKVEMNGVNKWVSIDKLRAKNYKV